MLRNPTQAEPISRQPIPRSGQRTSRKLGGRKSSARRRRPKVPGAEERKAGGFRNGSGVTVSKCSKTFPPAVVGIGDEEQVIACRGDADIIPSTCDVCELCPKGFAGKDPQQLPVRRRVGVGLEIFRGQEQVGDIHWDRNNS